MLSRNETAAQLGMSVQNLRYLERVGQIRSVVGRDGRRFFRPAAVEALAAERAERGLSARTTYERIPIEPLAPLEVPEPRAEQRPTPSPRTVAPPRRAPIERVGERAFLTDDGARQGLVFSLLKQGLSCVDVTIRTGIEIRVVCDIAKLWLTPEEATTPDESLSSTGEVAG